MRRLSEVSACIRNFENICVTRDSWILEVKIISPRRASWQARRRCWRAIRANMLAGVQAMLAAIQANMLAGVLPMLAAIQANMLAGVQAMLAAIQASILRACRRC